MSFACYFFTQGWNQGDFGQYYLYDNLLDSSSGLTDDALLTLAVVGGGLGGGYRPRYAPAHGHYYPTTPEPEPESEPLYRRRRSGILSTPNTDEPSTATASRRRRQATSTDESSTGSASRRRRAVLHLSPQLHQLSGGAVPHRPHLLLSLPPPGGAVLHLLPRHPLLIPGGAAQHRLAVILKAMKCVRATRICAKCFCQCFLCNKCRL